jgi:hypothetical protein
MPEAGMKSLPILAETHREIAIYSAETGRTM